MLDDRQRKLVCSRVSLLLREERERSGLSMSAVGKKAGLSQQMISYIEREMRQPTLDTLLRICEVLKLELWSVLKTASEKKAK